MRLVPLGAVAKPHGVRGEVHVRLFNAESTLLLEYDAVWLRPPEREAYQAEVEFSRPANRSVLLKLVGCDTREDAEALRGAEVCLPREAFPEPDADEYYHVDLVGLRVRDAAGTELGTVTDVVEYPSVACLRVSAPDGEREVPMTDAFVSSVDTKAREVVVSGFDELPISKERARRKT